MNSREAHKIWIEQCEAAQTIRGRFGLKAAFDYIVGEKLLNFAEASFRHRAFAQELPRFVSEVRRMFTSEEIAAELTRIERELNEKKIFWTRTISFVKAWSRSPNELVSSQRSRNC
jgi:hypothetical protein